MPPASLLITHCAGLGRSGLGVRCHQSLALTAINLHLGDLASSWHFHDAIPLLESVLSLPKYSNPYDCAYSVQTPVEAADNPTDNNAPDARRHKQYGAGPMTL